MREIGAGTQNADIAAQLNIDVRGFQSTLKRITEQLQNEGLIPEPAVVYVTESGVHRKRIIDFWRAYQDYSPV